MNTILYFFRDTISGTYYFIYCFFCLLFMFSIIGYLFKQKYAKVEVKLSTSQSKEAEDSKKTPKKDKKNVQTIQKKEVNGEKGILGSTLITQEKPNVTKEVQVVKPNPQVVNLNANTSTINQSKIGVTQTQVVNSNPQVINQNLNANNLNQPQVKVIQPQAQQTPIQPQPNIPLKKVEIPKIK